MWVCGYVGRFGCRITAQIHRSELFNVIWVWSRGWNGEMEQRDNSTGPGQGAGHPGAFPEPHASTWTWKAFLYFGILEHWVLR